MEYKFQEIEKKWQDWWNANEVYKVSNHSDKPKYYVLDMFPYPSGAGLHVGHPLGYIASDIYARFKRLKGFNVLHPMGYDAFGLPAEQYAIEHGIHPAISTEQNIKNFRNQLDKIGFSFDWDREVKTSDPSYYKWTQWIFLQLFKSYFNRKTKKAESIGSLVEAFEKEGNKYYPIPNSQFLVPGSDSATFTSEEWNSFDEFTQQSILMEYRLAYCGYGEVNWCEALGTVLANDEVINGVSERGGYPVVKKKLRQWYLRITEYADRLLEGLETVDFSDAMKEMQTNWIGKSYGAEIDFRIANSDEKLRVFTTRPDTIFGVDFMVIAPEHELTEKITTEKHKEEVSTYLSWVKSRSERERMAEKQISGVFTGAYAINPFDRREVPVYISEYVLAGYGTGAIMAVPCGDERDFKFAKHFNIDITNILGDKFNGEEANPTKDAELENSNFLTGMLMKDAIKVVMNDIEGLGYGKAKVNYKMRDAAFSRQRYWGEPFPIIWQPARLTNENQLTAGGNGIAYPVDESELPLELPYMEDIKPGKDGEGPLSNLTSWTRVAGGAARETSTMPGYAGSSWYFLRYMDPHNDSAFCSRHASDYWNQVDIYIGGTEHAVGHLLYSRMWTKFLYDMDLIGHDEPYRRLVNQGMIGAYVKSIYRLNYSYKSGEGTSGIVNAEQFIKRYGIQPENYKPDIPGIFISKDIAERIITNSITENEKHLIDNAIEKVLEVKKNIPGLLKFSENTVSEITIEAFLVENDVLNINAFQIQSRLKNPDNIFITSKDHFYCNSDLGKMGKRYYNSVNPDDLVEKYGADTFRMYEMFLGPVEQSKPWDTKGIEGVHRFLRKLWRLFYDENTPLSTKWREAGGEGPTASELKALHRAIKKIEEDTERFSFNTAVSAFMVCVNELSDLKCSKKEILEPLLILLAPYAPHICEELWHALGNTTTILDSDYPVLEEKYLVESTKEYPISINGRLRTTMNIALDASQKEVESLVLQNAVVQKWLQDNQPKKIIFVKGKMVNVVV